MADNILGEYKTCTAELLQAKQELRTLPQGYISQKTINGKVYHYLQARAQGKLQSRYIKRAELAEMTEQIALAKAHKASIPLLEKRLAELEIAAKLVDGWLYRQLMRIKLADGLDGLAVEQKEKSSTFADSMNAIEGVSVSHETRARIVDWQAGRTSFHGVLQQTLAMYGFEVNEHA